MVTQTVRVVAPLNAAGQNISVTTPRMTTLQNRFVTVSTFKTIIYMFKRNENVKKLLARWAHLF